MMIVSTVRLDQNGCMGSFIERWRCFRWLDEILEIHRITQGRCEGEVVGVVAPGPGPKNFNL